MMDDDEKKNENIMRCNEIVTFQSANAHSRASIIVLNLKTGDRPDKINEKHKKKNSFQMSYASLKSTTP